MTLAPVAAVAFAVLAAVVIAFQVAVAVGAPWGEFTMGGRSPGRLGPAMRASAAVQALLLAVIAIFVLWHAGLVLRSLPAPGAAWMWGVVGLSAITVLTNTLTPSARERRVWLPVAVAMLVCSVLVALNA